MRALAARWRSLPLILAVGSLLLWSGWEVFRPLHHPFRDLNNGLYTDQFSHYNAARLFMSVGPDIWRKPISELARPLTMDERWRLPPDVKVAAWPRGEAYTMPGWPADKPLIASWSHSPRFYPPGDMLLFAPVALAYHFTSISFSTANLLILVLLLAYAHVSLYWVFRELLGDGELERAHLFALLVVYCWVIKWTLEGFYDAAAIAPLVLSARALSRGNGLHALAFYCSAVFIHFRALFLAPWAVVAAIGIIRRREWQRWTRRDFALAGVTALLGGAALYAFFLVHPSLGHLPISNEISIGTVPLVRPQTLAFGVIALVCGGLLAGFGAWLDLAVLLWMTLMAFQLRQGETWHEVVLLGWICSPVLARRPNLARDVRLFFFLCLVIFALRENPLPQWLSQVF